MLLTIHGQGQTEIMCYFRSAQPFYTTLRFKKVGDPWSTSIYRHSGHRSEANVSGLWQPAMDHSVSLRPNCTYERAWKDSLSSRRTGWRRNVAWGFMGRQLKAINFHSVETFKGHTAVTLKRSSLFLHFITGINFLKFIPNDATVKNELRALGFF